jgi:gallate decarboxylase subunit D
VVESPEFVGVEHFCARDQRFVVRALAYALGDELVVSIYGGQRAHIGAAGLSVPRPSLRCPERTSASTSVLTLPGHKEDWVVKEVGEYLASALNKVVVVVAGIHYDELDDHDVRVVGSLTRDLAADIVRRFG